MRRDRSVALLCAASALIATGTILAAEKQTLWHVKAVHPKGHLLDIKAVDAEGTLYDVKAIQHGDNVHMLDVKAFLGDRPHPVKVVASEDRYAPVRAINIHGRNLDLKALTAEGKQLAVKGVRRSGSIIHIKALGVGRLYAVKAVSPDGRMYDVKGIKMMPDNIEIVIGATRIHAHVKALPPAGAW